MNESTVDAIWLCVHSGLPIGDSLDSRRCAAHLFAKAPCESALFTRSHS